MTDNLLFPMIRFVNIGLPLLHAGVSAEILKISDHQQNVAPAPSSGLPHTPSSAGGR